MSEDGMINSQIPKLIATVKGLLERIEEIQTASLANDVEINALRNLLYANLSELTFEIKQLSRVIKEAPHLRFP